MGLYGIASKCHGITRDSKDSTGFEKITWNYIVLQRILKDCQQLLVIAKYCMGLHGIVKDSRTLHEIEFDYEGKGIAFDRMGLHRDVMRLQ